MAHTSKFVISHWVITLPHNNLKLYVQAMNPFNIYKACDFLDTDLVNYDNNTKTFGSPTTLKSFVIGVNIGF